MNEPPEDTPSFQQAFSFERGVLPASDGSFFQPMRDASCRWISQRPAPYAVLGESFRVLYQRKAGGYFFLECLSDQTRVVESPQGLRKIWMVDGQLHAHNISDLQAVQFLIREQQAIPDSLQPALEEFASQRRTAREPPMPRPLEYWASKDYLWHVEDQDASQVKVADALQTIAESGTYAVQEIRDWSGGQWHNRKHFSFDFLVHRLFTNYSLAPEKWWGAGDRVPPQSLELLDLRWPDGIDDAREIINQLRELVQTPATVMRCNMFPFQHPDYARPEELDAAQLSLIADLPEIEECVIDLQAELELLKTGKAVEATRASRGKRRPPLENAFTAYRLRIATGATQDQIAKMLTTYKTPASQGQVSRWIREVENWITAGNVLPPVQDQPVEKAQTVDPSVIDMGANQEGRTPRQRNREADD